MNTSAARTMSCLLVVLVLAACQDTPLPPTEVPTPEPTMAAQVAPTMPEPTAPPGKPAICWYGSVVSLPEEAEYDDYLLLVPDEAGELGIEGANEEIEAAIVALRDAEEPGKYAHFTGTVFCEVQDVGGCKLVVDEVVVYAEGEPSEPLAVEGWDGVFESIEVGEDEEGAVDDYFVLGGDFPIRYGVSSVDELVEAQVDELHDTEIPVRITGLLTCGAPDYNGTLIELTGIE